MRVQLVIIRSKHKAKWVSHAQREGKTLERWITETLNKECNNDRHIESDNRSSDKHSSANGNLGFCF